MQSLLNEHLAANWAGPLESDTAAAIDQAPAPGSLALDPALSAGGFEGSTLEELTDELLAATTTTASKPPDGQQSADIRWEDVAAHPIFEVETSFSSSQALGNGTDPVPKPAVTLRVQSSPTMTPASAPRKRHMDASASASSSSSSSSSSSLSDKRPCLGLSPSPTLPTDTLMT